MNFRNKRTITLAVILVIAVFSFTALGAAIGKTVEIYFNDVKINIDGLVIDPKDGAGETVEPFILDGTTYLPVRAVANAFGKDVDWDAETNTVLITTPDGAPANELTMGYYLIGEDFPAGKYDVIVLSGSGNFYGSVASLGLLGLNVILAEEGDDRFQNSSPTYQNLVLADGDNLVIAGNLELQFVSVR